MAPVGFLLGKYIGIVGTSDGVNAVLYEGMAVGFSVGNSLGEDTG